jgi:hypothetical protein
MNVPALALRFVRLLVVNDGMPRMAARAAMTPGDRGVAAKHLLDGHVVVGSALRTHVRDARVLDLLRGQLA